MVNEETYRQLTDMQLFTMAASLREMLEGQEHDSLTFPERVAIMVDREWTERHNRRLKTRLTKAKLREPACFEDINYRHPRGLDRSVMQRLGTCKWIKEHENVIFTGATGLGKTWLACALVHTACQQGCSALYTRVPRLLQELYVARGAGTYPKVLDRLAKPDILLMDDFGMASLTDTERHDLLEVIEDRQGRKSTIVTSQLPVKHWHEVIGEPTIADAIMDRLVANSHRVELTGKRSLRGKKGEKAEEQSS